MRVSNDFSGALRTFARFIVDGSHYMMNGYEYLDVFRDEGTSTEIVFAIFANVIEMDEAGTVLNFTYAQKRATDYLKNYIDPSYKISPPLQVWESEVFGPPPLQDKI